VCCLRVPKEKEQWLVFEGEISRRGGEGVVIAWKRVCRWCRMCYFGVVGLRGRMVILEEGRVIVI
jgi:hypothetical protein